MLSTVSHIVSKSETDLSNLFNFNRFFLLFSAKAKNELSANLHHRMKWVVFIQNQISEVGQLLVMHVEELRRLRRKLDVVEQIHVSF